MFLTGPGDDREAVLDGIRAIADEGERAGVVVALEPIQREFAHLWTIPTSLEEAATCSRRRERRRRPHVRHVAPLEPAARADRAVPPDRIAAVHIADWRDPTRNTNDRVPPGDGVIDFGPILEALRWDGLYDLEIFSDAELPRLALARGSS